MFFVQFFNVKRWLDPIYVNHYYRYDGTKISQDEIRSYLELKL